MRVPFATLMLALSAVGHSVQAQATTISAPPDDYLLEVTQRWEAESVLGSLPRRVMAAGDVELRVWGGYGLGGTRGVVLRRAGGRWLAWEAHVVPCRIDVPIPVADTASAATESLYVARARLDCNAWQTDTLAAATMYDADTLAVRTLPSAKLGAVWAKAVAAGVRELPPSVPRKWTMLDGFSYVVELREGNAYRASVIEHKSPPEVDADRQVQEVYKAVVEALAPVRRLAPQ